MIAVACIHYRLAEDYAEKTRFFVLGNARLLDLGSTEHFGCSERAFASLNPGWCFSAVGIPEKMAGHGFSFLRFWIVSRR